MWKEIQEAIEYQVKLAEEKANLLVQARMDFINNIPHEFGQDSANETVLDCLESINCENGRDLPVNVYPISGGMEHEGYGHMSVEFTFVNVATGEFLGCYGSCCSCDGLEGQLGDLDKESLEALVKTENKLVIDVVRYLAENEEELQKYIIN